MKMPGSSFLTTKYIIIVSACLAGINCRYNATSKPDKKVISLVKQGKAIPVCPEQLGGLPTPRPPVEKVGEKYLDAQNRDYTGQFQRGAREAWRIAKLHHCSKAMLKAKSPSCGCDLIYDGTFRGKLTKGDGCFCALLKKAGIKVQSL